MQRITLIACSTNYTHALTQTLQVQVLKRYIPTAAAFGGLVVGGLCVIGVCVYVCVCVCVYV